MRRFLLLLAVLFVASTASAQNVTVNRTEPLEPGQSATVTVVGEVATITGITAAASAVVTSNSHTFLVTDKVTFSGVGGMTQINGLTGTVTAKDANTFTVDINSSGFGAYTSGGTGTLVAEVALSLGRCETYSVSFISNTSNSTDHDNTLAGWRCPRGGALSANTCRRIGPLLTGNADVGLDIFYADTPPDQLWLKFGIVDQQTSSSEVICR